MSRGHQSGNLAAGVQPAQAFPTEQALNGYAEHVYQEPEGEPPVETNSIRAWRDWPGLRNGQTELRLNNHRAPRVHGLGWALDPDNVWRPLRVDAAGALVVTGGGPSPTPEPPTSQLSAWYRAGDIVQAGGSTVFTWSDRSGNGADLVPVPGLGQPTLATNVSGFGGQSAVNFAIGQALYRLLPPGFVGGDSAYSLYIVHKPIFYGALFCAFSWGQDNASLKRVSLLLQDVSGTWSVGTDSYAAGSNAYACASVPQINSARLAHGANVSTTEFLIDGAVGTQTSAGGGGPLNLASPVVEVRMGGFTQANVLTYNGQIAEVLVYHKRHNNNERNATLAYLSARYGIPVA